MTFNQFIQIFSRAGMQGQYIVLPDDSYINEVDLRNKFEAAYDPAKAHASLSTNPNTTEGWKAIWDDMKAKGLIN